MKLREATERGTTNNRMMLEKQFKDMLEAIEEG
jgi:hypothetical protein